MQKKQSTAGEIIRFSLPLVLSGILQQLYSWADAFIVGHAEGEMQLGAIGATGSISILLISTITGLTLGLSINAAQEFGRGNGGVVRKILGNFLPIMVIIYGILSAAAIALSGTILQLMHTPAEIFDYSVEYLRIVLIGIPFMAVYNLYAALLRAVGNTRAAFYAVLLSSCLNVVLDILLVVALHMGVGGAAFATVISQASMTIFMAMYASRKYAILKLDRDSLAPDRKIFREGASFAVPPTVQNSVTSFGNVILQNFMNSFGAVTVLAITTAYRVDSLMLLPIINLGAAVSSMVARAKGAEDTAHIRSCFKTGVVMMIVVAALLTLVMFLFGAEFVGMFGVTGDALAEGRQFFRDLATFYVLFGVATVFRSVLEGIGDITYCSIIGIGTLGLRIANSYIMRTFFHERTIAFAEGVAWIVLFILMALRIWTKRQEIGFGKTKEG